MIAFLEKLAASLLDTLPLNRTPEPGEFPPPPSLFDANDRVRRTPGRYSDVEEAEDVHGAEEVRAEGKGRYAVRGNR